MSTIYCIALIIYMEGRNQPEITQTHLASFAIEKADKHNMNVCKTLKIPGLYSWNWDGKETFVDQKHLKGKIYPVAQREWQRQKRTLSGFSFFNVCKGKKFKGKVFKSNDICFYEGSYAGENKIKK